MFCLPFHTITADSDSSCIYNSLTREALNYLWLRTPVYEKQGPKWCIASPGGPQRVQTYPGLGSTTRMPFSPDTGKPRTAIRGRANPHGSGSVETPLSKHLLSQRKRKFPRTPATPVAVLVQRQDGAERVIAYASRALSKAEQNYSTTDKECLAVVWALTKFRPYLYGIPFRVVTDHHALCWLANLKDPSGRLARWSLRLQEFDVTIVHKSGRKHNDADCLSRAPVESPPDSTDDDDDARFLGAVTDIDMGALQRDDPELRAVIDHLEGQGSSVPRVLARDLPSFVLRQGVLFKKNFGTSNPPWLLVVPASLREEIFQACHDDPTAGHLGYSRTLARIRDKYYWPRFPKTVHLYTRSCHECQRRKKPPTKPAGLLQPIPAPTTPFQQIGMDLLGPFPTSTQGNRWIIVATDYLTRYAETKALPSGTAVEVAKFLSSPFSFDTAHLKC
ncbi:Transposon Tf2-6 polyprotein [Ixodes scapularis]